MVDSRSCSAADEALTRIELAEASGELEAVRRPLREYRNWFVEHREIASYADSILEIGLLDMDREIDSLPWEYQPPGGALFLATRGGVPVGTSALRREAEGTAELARVYVQPTARGQGIGRRPSRAALDRARDLGYRRVVLNTLPTMQAAVHLYGEMGFSPIGAYWANPVPDALFMEYRLDSSRTR